MEVWVRAALALLLFPVMAESMIRHYQFNVVTKNFTKLCSSKPVVTVNGKFPGPTLYAREGDTVLVKVTNHIQYNVTIHWHGVRQLRTCWSDGPAFITQCPIQPGQTYLYNFTITMQRGTLLWHAHISWLRATVHGAIVILPSRGTPYPFPKPHKQVILVLGEWWKADTETVVNQATQSGMPPNVSDSHTINGRTGPVPNCSFQDPYSLNVDQGRTYLLRIINAAVNDELFFKIAGHRLTVVEVDASYTKPFTTDTIYIAPGQTTNALLAADQPPAVYSVAISSFMDAPVGVDNLTNYAVLRYKSVGIGNLSRARVSTAMPALNATASQSNFSDSLRCLNSPEYPAWVPTTVDHDLFFTMGVGVNPCATCLNGSRLVGDINNVTFSMPSIALLNARYFKIPGVYTEDFPGRPATVFNYTGNYTGSLATQNGTRLYRLSFNSTVQIVLQDTGIIAPESHPTHLHGFNFYVVGKGLGNFDPVQDPMAFNLVDPVERNTVDAPTGGWVAIRFRSDNPGVWFLHCHLEVHTTWGLKMAFVVDDGEGPNQSLPPPPKDLPKC